MSLWLPSDLWPDPNSDVESELFYEAFVNPELTRDEQIEAKYEWYGYLGLDDDDDDDEGLWDECMEEFKW